MVGNDLAVLYNTRKLLKITLKKRLLANLLKRGYMHLIDKRTIEIKESDGGALSAWSAVGSRQLQVEYRPHASCSVLRWTTLRREGFVALEI